MPSDYVVEQEKEPRSKSLDGPNPGCMKQCLVIRLNPKYAEERELCFINAYF